MMTSTFAESIHRLRIIIIGVSALLVAACAAEKESVKSAPPEAVPTSETWTSFDWGTIPREDVGYPFAVDVEDGILVTAPPDNSLVAFNAGPKVDVWGWSEANEGWESLPDTGVFGPDHSALAFVPAKAGTPTDSLTVSMWVAWLPMQDGGDPDGLDDLGPPGAGDDRPAKFGACSTNKFRNPNGRGDWRTPITTPGGVGPALLISEFYATFVSLVNLDGKIKAITANSTCPPRCVLAVKTSKLQIDTRVTKPVTVAGDLFWYALVKSAVKIRLTCAAEF